MIPQSLEAAAGQVLVVGYEGVEPPALLRDRAAAGALGGFILFRRNVGNPSEVAALTAGLRALFPPGLPPWIAIDQEGGRVARLGSPVVRLPAARVLGDLDDVALTLDAGALLGRQLGWLGINLDFAPVLDVATNPHNPVIGDRSFGADAARVIRHARAFAAGLAQSGITACGKHFPGHGDTAQDSHHTLPRLTHDEARLRQVELAPFAALAAELPCIMTAHVVFEAWDPGVPATLSARVVSGLLRDQLGFRGLVFSDDLEMKAIAGEYGLNEAACRAIDAGCDALLVCSKQDHVESAYAGLLRRAERDRAFAARLENAAARSLAARREHAGVARTPEDLPRLLERTSAELEARLSRARMV
ncbi:MAG TPA: beta-N-acetylhexosaminidase [Polyangiales bacterium]|nr:beta-N-acetylhexosaminidase [Polyangiales bacterium]